MEVGEVYLETRSSRSAQSLSTDKDLRDSIPASAPMQAPGLSKRSTNNEARNKSVEILLKALQSAAFPDGAINPKDMSIWCGVSFRRNVAQVSQRPWRDLTTKKPQVVLILRRLKFFKTFLFHRELKSSLKSCNKDKIVE
ncbi:unnamed protein product [Toxocara canis]|uniref:Uncharacterized protein n=1 Tax=Toxocara canis TaxID=6265 RepID=A0A183U2Q4_TOXCA|nr:unnamed protein product [Toxocara canis]